MSEGSSYVENDARINLITSNSQQTLTRHFLLYLYKHTHLL